MRPNLTDTFRGMLSQAQAEARALNQEYVGAEHLVLGLLDCPDSDAVRVLRAGHVQEQALREALLRLLPRGTAPPVVTGDLPLSPKVQQLVNAALLRAQAQQEPLVSTRLALLAALEEPQSAIRQALRACGGDVDELQRILAEKPGQGEK